VASYYVVPRAKNAKRDGRATLFVPKKATAKLIPECLLGHRAKGRRRAVRGARGMPVSQSIEGKIPTIDKQERTSESAPQDVGADGGPFIPRIKGKP
jgi:hypothetical protein